MSERHAAKYRVLRAIVVCAGALGAALTIVGLLPGADLYRDVNDCAGDAMRRLFSAHGSEGGGSCTPEYELVDSKRVVDDPWGIVFLIALLAPGAMVWRRPRLGTALLWSMLSIAIAYFVVLWSFDLDGLFSSTRTVVLWPARMFSTLIIALFVLLIAIVPIVCGVLAVATRPRRPRPPKPELPSARIHRR